MLRNRMSCNMIRLGIDGVISAPSDIPGSVIIRIGEQAAFLDQRKAHTLHHVHQGILGQPVSVAAGCGGRPIRCAVVNHHEMSARLQDAGDFGEGDLRVAQRARLCAFRCVPEFMRAKEPGDEIHFLIPDRFEIVEGCLDMGDIDQTPIHALLDGIPQEGFEFRRVLEVDLAFFTYDKREKLGIDTAACLHVENRHAGQDAGEFQNLPGFSDFILFEITLRPVIMNKDAVIIERNGIR